MVVTHYFLGGKEIAFRKGTTLEYLHTDHLGSTSVTSNSSGKVIDTVKYFPFGGTRSSTAPLATDKLFTGQRLDQTGLYFYNARYYDATIGRFISPDSVIPEPFNPQSLNRYSYCSNNPLRYTDPSGHDYLDFAIAGYFAQAAAAMFGSGVLEYGAHAAAAAGNADAVAAISAVQATYAPAVPAVTQPVVPTTPTPSAPRNITGVDAFVGGGRIGVGVCQMILSPLVFVTITGGTVGIGTGPGWAIALWNFNSGWTNVSEGLSQSTGGRIDPPNWLDLIPDSVKAVPNAMESNVKDAVGFIERVLSSPWEAGEAVRGWFR